MKIYLILAISSLLAACATTPPNGPISGNTLYSIEATGQIGDSQGVLVMSAGRERDPCDECNANWAGILPFISYHLMHEYEEGKYKEIAFIPAEAGAFSQIGKKRYGFIHMRELPEGKYVMLGDNSRGRPMMIAGGGFFLMMDDCSNETGIAYEFEVQEGKINYLGEFVTENGILENSSILLSDEKDRDLEYAYKKYPKLKTYEVIKVEATNSNKKVKFAR